ncbi:hypothetical protein NA57DRAFT_57565 [Rhizodiscina lignyota]|uniref:RING-type domain-containing protein n=1 Tax=Rhizodiscina lignyota TaxID=1504668 RepID=A0A9P4M554_9PEZI|nr:hypothetical protein NA57DRAFT_57565 [Rhizodiscina lignyota]
MVYHTLEEHLANPHLTYFPIKQALINSLPVTVVSTDFKPQYGAWRDAHCGICLVDYEESDLVTTLPCGHYLHVDCCGELFLALKMDCPECRAQSFSPWATRAAMLEQEFNADTMADIDVESQDGDEDDEEAAIHTARTFAFARQIMCVSLTLALECPSTAGQERLVGHAGMVHQRVIGGLRADGEEYSGCWEMWKWLEDIAEHVLQDTCKEEERMAGLVEITAEEARDWVERAVSRCWLAQEEEVVKDREVTLPSALLLCAERRNAQCEEAWEQ